MHNNLQLIKSKSISLLDKYIFSSFRNFFAISHHNNESAISLKNRINKACSIESIYDDVLKSQDEYANDRNKKEKSLSRYYLILVEIKALCESELKTLDSILGLSQQHQIKNITLSGGGAKGACYSGVYSALKNTDIFENVNEIAGSSAGAMAAALFATGATPENLTNSLRNQKFKELLGKGLFNKIQLSGDPLREYMRELIVQNIRNIFKAFDIDNIQNIQNIRNILGNEIKNNINDVFNKIFLNNRNTDITFSDLQKCRSYLPHIFKNLIITGTDKSRGRLEIFSYQTTPNMSIALACRISGSIPILFKSLKINNRKIVDGGYIDNLPTDFFEDKDKSKTLVFAFAEGDETNNPVYNAINTDIRQKNLVKNNKTHSTLDLYNPSKIERFKRNVIGGIGIKNSKNTLNKNIGFKKLQHHYSLRVVPLYVGDISTTDFDKAQENFDRLHNTGYEATINYLNLYYYHS